MANNLSGFYSPQPALWTDSVATSSGTRAAPTLSTEGMDLSGIRGYRVIVSADSGQTLSGGGTMQAWVYSADVDSGNGGWLRNPDLDFSITTSGKRFQASADYQVTVPYGRVVYAAASVTRSSGEITTQIAAWMGN